MKVAVCSDIHLEFGPIELTNPGDVDVLILSGDICVAKDFDRPSITKYHDKTLELHKFFETCSKEFPHVVYIAGNHEHYHFDYKYTLSTLKRELSKFTNIHVLDKESFEYKDVVFFGGTLWTDMNREDEHTLLMMRSMMNDFRTVKNSNRMISYKENVYKLDEKLNAIRDENGSMIVERVEFHERPALFTPHDAVEDHKQFLKALENFLKETPADKKVVVCGHHAPSKASTHPRYKNETVMNGGYSSSLDEFILNNPNIKLWTHGHTHEDFDYMIGSTRIVCNPRGYINYEARADNFNLKVVEV